MQTYLEKLQHVSQFSTDFQAASAAVAAFMYQVSVVEATAGPRARMCKISLTCVNRSWMRYKSISSFQGQVSGTGVKRSCPI